MSRSLLPHGVGLAAGLLWLATSLSAHGQGTIRYVPNVNLSFPDGDTPWDIDGDGDGEFVFQANGRSLVAIPQPGNFILAQPSPPPDLGSWVVPLTVPSELGNFDYSPIQWVGYQEAGGYPIGSAFNNCGPQGCVGGFVGIRAYFGFSLTLEDQVYYGWALFDVSWGGPGGILEEYAYNLTPGAPIFVGQVPEPDTWALLLVGASLLGWRVWRNRQRV
jgi:hypothetical protein